VKLEVSRDGSAVFRSAFPDLQTAVKDLIAEGDKVVIHWESRGTHRGEFMGLAPTQKPVTLSGITRVVGGKCVEDWTQFDALGLLQQLGAVQPL
jgi:predicted ester cyclase